MIIEKKYHFYAAHRNRQADEKCARIHGHTYEISCHFKFSNFNSGIAMLFSDIDKVIEPIVKQYDHSFLIYTEDPLCELLREAGEPFIELPFETSAENLAKWIFDKINFYTDLHLVKIELAETKSSKVIYEQQA